jgi:hypothetical protein
MILCEAVALDEATGRPSVLGVLSAIAGRSEPVLHPRLTVFVERTDGRGSANVAVRILRSESDMQDEPPIAALTTTVTFPSPLFVAQLVFGFWDLSFPQAGDYRATLEVDGNYVIERKLTITTPE